MGHMPYSMDDETEAEQEQDIPAFCQPREIDGTAGQSGGILAELSGAIPQRLTNRRRSSGNSQLRARRLRWHHALQSTMHHPIYHPVLVHIRVWRRVTVPFGPGVPAG